MKYIAVLLLAGVLMFGCSDQAKIEELTQQNQQLKTEKDRLQEQAELKNQFIESYTKTVNEVYSNIENIRKKEGLVTSISKDMETNKDVSLREKMNENLSSIDDYIQKSKGRINQLKEKMYANQLQSASLEENIQKLEKTLEAKETRIVELKSEVQNLTAQVTQAEEQITSQAEIIEDQFGVINTAYYVIGNENDLKNKGIIVEKGGILGLRKTKKLADNFDPYEFRTMDKSTTTAIPINEDPKKVEIISPHNPDSYYLTQTEENQTVLEIVNPDEFWKIKYLVILTKS